MRNKSVFLSLLKFRRYNLLVAILLLTSCASYRIQENPSGEEVTTNKLYLSEDSEDQIVCRKEKVMGSNLRQNVCYRKRDLDAKSKLDQEDYREMTTRAVRPTIE